MTTPDTSEEDLESPIADLATGKVGLRQTAVKQPYEAEVPEESTSGVDVDVGESADTSLGENAYGDT